MSVIDACARCQGTLEQQTEAIKIAFAVLKAIEVDDASEANSVTFATLLKAVSSLLPAGGERNKVASAVFQKAKAAGLLEVNILRNLRKTVDGAVWVSLTDEVSDQNGNFDYTKLPASWCKNVKQ